MFNLVLIFAKCHLSVSEVVDTNSSLNKNVKCCIYTA